MNNKIKGFKWYLPLAFKDSVGQCKFEQGDVIYPTKMEGKNWGENIEEFDFLIQVKSPTRSQSTTNSNLDVFNSNWNSNIIFEKIYPKNPDLNKKIETTQGAFYTFLWKNDESFFNNQQNLKPIITSISTKRIKYDFIKNKIPTDWTGFAIIVDYVNDISLSKRQLVENVLTQNFNVRLEKFEIENSVSLDSENSDFSPTLGLELFLIQSKDITQIQKHLKDVLFKGVKNRFNVNTHGLLIENEIL
mgnify:FL=1|tara:strand:+ start:243 stop:980 length:738 start_codon:yes stop_codon:yes gene_type:complete